jgi:hypothetical protein
LLAASRAPLARVPGHLLRVEYADLRHGACNLFLRAEPFQGGRPVMVTTQRTKREFAHGPAEGVNGHVPEAETIRVVLDNLSPHPPGALDDVFSPAAARRLLRKLECHPTPGPGSWVNMAEIALAVLARQCLPRRIPEATPMAREVAAWEARRTRHQATIDWRVTTKEARINLTSLYPKESE